jgi:signal transduction histidine kinase
VSRGEDGGFRSDSDLPEQGSALTPARYRAVAASLPLAALALWLLAPDHGAFSVGSGFAAVAVAALVALAAPLWTAAARLRRTAADRARAERERDRAARELADRESACRRRVDEVEHELDAFLHSISHDLRAPLRHVDAYSALLRESLGEQLDPAAAGHLRAVLDASAQLNRQIDALVALARASRAPLEPTAVDMNRLFEKARAAVAPLAEGRSIAWDVASLAPVQGSEPLLLLVWSHLLSNALRFTATREQAHIRVTARERPDGWIVTSVTDDGVGFDPRGKDRLFGVFERLHGEESGLGTGLATVRRVIERHGGEVCAEGAVGAGATFSFTLPPATATTARAEDAGP